MDVRIWKGMARFGLTIHGYALCCDFPRFSGPELILKKEK